jgi:hypothetical protein
MKTSHQAEQSLREEGKHKKLGLPDFSGGFIRHVE